jgi:uncharacterized membrane protein
MKADDLILQNFYDKCSKYNQKNNRGGSFSPFRYYKFNEGSGKPVYFIGGPGFSVAVVTTLIIAVAFILFIKEAGFWYWLLFLFVAVIALRIGLKIDKAKQIRCMAASLGMHAVSMVESALNTEDEYERRSLLNKSVEFLDESLKWVEEPIFEEQKKILEKYIKKGNP